MRGHGFGRLLTWTVAAFYVFLVTACGGGGGSTNSPPTANAGAEQTVYKNTSVTLDGSISTDPDGDSLTFAWTQTSGPAVTLNGASSSKPTFTAPSTMSTLTFSLVVNDGHTNSTAASVTIEVQNRAPTAMGGSNTSMLAGNQFTLDGTGSSDPDGDALTYTWTQLQGPPVTLTPSTGSAKATFTAPLQSGTLQFQLVVNDGEASSQPSTVTITVTTDPLPVAMAGADQTVPRRSLTQLQGSGHDSDQQPLTYQWQQISGTPVTIQNATSANSNFDAPPTAGDLQFSLTVNDGINNSQPSYITVHVVNRAPVVAVTLMPAIPRRNDPISAVVNASDPDGDPITLSYAWTRNGTVVPSATGSAYALGNQAKNDTISVTVTASDGTTTTTGSAGVVIADTLATLVSNAPGIATFGAATAFQVTATDVDGDPSGPFELAYGPAGMTVSSSGQVSYTPSGPLFDRSVDMHWAVRLHDTPAANLSGTITVTDANRKYPLLRTNASSAANSNSLEVQDFAGDGNQEMLIGAQQSLYLLQKSGSDYVQVWAYPFDTGAGASIQAVASGDVDGDGHREIFFSAGSVVVELDGVTRREIARYISPSSPGPGSTTTSSSCMQLKVADIDNDGSLELVCLGIDSNSSIPQTGRVYVLDARTLHLKWKTDNLILGYSLAVGNVDADPALEIVTSAGYVFDGATGANEWSYGSGFGQQVEIGDVKGDGVGKIVGMTLSGIVLPTPAGLVVYDAVAKTPSLTIAPPTQYGFYTFKVAKLDGTSPAEIVTADSQGGNVRVFRYIPSSGGVQELTHIDSLGGYVTAIGAGDVDGDGQQEIIWTPSPSSISSYPTLAIASWTPTATLKWTGPTPVPLDGPFVCAKLAKVSATQRGFMYVTPQTSVGHGGTRAILLDPTSGAVSVSPEVDSNFSHERACDVADVYGTGTDSVLVSTAHLYNNYFTVFDFLSGAKLWSSAQSSFDGVAVAHADMNGDGVPDLITLTTDGSLSAWDVLHQQLIWSASGVGYGVDLVVADLYADGNQEIVALGSDKVTVWAPSGSNLTQKASYSVSGSDLLVADTDGDGKPEIFVLANNYSLSTQVVYRLDNTLTPLNSYTISSWNSPQATSLYLEESAFARKNIVVAFGPNNLGVPVASELEVIDPSSGAEIWDSPPLRGNVPINSLNFYDLNGTGQLQIAFGTNVGMYLTQ